MSEGWRFWFAFCVLWIACSLLGIGAVFLTINPANAQGMQCGPYADLKKWLAEKYHEEPSGSGVTAQGKAALMIFASPGGESWTVAVLGQDGNACILADGQDFEPVILPQIPGLPS